VTRPPRPRWPLIAPEQHYTVGAAAALAGVPRIRLEAAIAAKRLPATWGPRSRRVKGADLLAWMEREKGKGGG
jgi:excisionase family DNA binding protein